jgi:hypothetical protein
MSTTGGCLCGAIRYAYDGEVGPAVYCHCTDCRRLNGSAFNVGVRFERAAFEIERGEPKQFEKRGGSGFSISRWFCSECGSPIYTSSEKHPAHVFVKAGSLDDATVVHAKDQIWTDSAVSWGLIDPSLPAHPRARPA